MSDTRLLQQRLDSMLRFGIICSIAWMMGFGSLYAFACGLKARRMIRSSNGALVGMGKARWCILVGSIGMAVWLPVFALVVWRSIFPAA